MLSEGIAKAVEPREQTSSLAMVRVRGKRIVKIEPLPGVESTLILPLRVSICDRTIFMPTPRPESSLTLLAVENPGSNISSNIRSLLALAASWEEIKPFSSPFWVILAKSKPLPSSLTSITVWLP